MPAACPLKHSAGQVRLLLSYPTGYIWTAERMHCRQAVMLISCTQQSLAEHRTTLAACSILS